MLRRLRVPLGPRELVQLTWTSIGSSLNIDEKPN